VYCKDTLRRLDSDQIAFTFLGFTFRPRAARRKDGSMYMRFLPAISKDALRKISAGVRGWRLHRRDAVLRPLPAVSAVSAPGAHQRLPGAMDPQEVQATPGNSQSPPQAAGITARYPRMFAHWKWVPSAWM
jgi:RNA-directed DNA polymerase